MKHAETILELIGALSAEVQSLSVFKSEVMQHLGSLRMAVAGEPEAAAAGPQTNVLDVATKVIARLRREHDEAQRRAEHLVRTCGLPGAMPPGYDEAVRNARAIAGLDDGDEGLNGEG